MRVLGVLLIVLATLPAACAHRDIAARATAERERLGDYRVMEGRTTMADSDATWVAHLDADGIHYIRETMRQRDGGAADDEYWFDNAKLYAYVSRTMRGSEETMIYLGFDRAGALAERSKTVDGEPEHVLPQEVAAAKSRAAFLEHEAERSWTRPTSMAPPTFTTSPAVSGRMTLEGGSLRFAPCTPGAKRITIQDFPDTRGANLIRDLGGTATVLVRLDEERLREIRYAAPEGPACDRLPPIADVEARGTEPFWSVRVEGSEAMLRTPMESEGLVFRDGAWSRAGEGPWTYRAKRGSPSGVERLTVELTDGRCVDAMSGARYPLKAVVLRDATRVEGCALEGGKPATEAR